MKEQELLSEVARLYYEQNLTQMEISKRLYVSRSSVSRLIKQARDEGIVEITIHYPYDRMRKIEYEFSERFHLDEIRIAESENRTIHSDFTAVTKLGASYLNSLLSNEVTLGVTWGKSVCGTLRELRPLSYLPNMQVVQMAGAVETDNPILDGPDLVKFVADTYGCKYRYLMVPFTVENAEIRNSLIKRPSVVETLTMAEHADIFCSGIGSDRHWGKYLRPEELETLKNEGAIGYICGHYFDIDGNILDVPEFSNRTISVSSHIFQRVPFRVAVAADPVKANAILGALRGGLINALVTNTKTANKIIALDDKLKNARGKK